MELTQVLHSGLPWEIGFWGECPVKGTCYFPLNDKLSLSSSVANLFKQFVLCFISLHQWCVTANQGTAFSPLVLALKPPLITYLCGSSTED